MSTHPSEPNSTEYTQRLKADKRFPGSQSDNPVKYCNNVRQSLNVESVRFY